MIRESDDLCNSQRSLMQSWNIHISVPLGYYRVDRDEWWIYSTWETYQILWRDSQDRATDNVLRGEDHSCILLFSRYRLRIWRNRSRAGWKTRCDQYSQSSNCYLYHLHWLGSYGSSWGYSWGNCWRKSWYYQAMNTSRDWLWFSLYPRSYGDPQCSSYSIIPMRCSDKSCRRTPDCECSTRLPNRTSLRYWTWKYSKMTSPCHSSRTLWVDGPKYTRWWSS